MNEIIPTVPPASPELLAEWEGPAIHEPGVLFEERQAEHLSAGGSVAELVAWLAAAAVSGMIGNLAYEAIKMKARGVLGAWRQRHGKAKLDEVKQELFVHIQQYRANRKISDEELRKRIDLLFEGI